MPKKLLVADDSVTIHKVIELILADEDFEITSVHNGKDAIKSLKDSTPDIVLADIEMPQVGGYELCKYIMDNIVTMESKKIPVILMASAFDTIDETEVSKCGAKGYIKKPFEAQELLNKLNSFTGQTPKSSPSKPAASKPPASKPVALRSDETMIEKSNSNVNDIDIDALLSEDNGNNPAAEDAQQNSDNILSEGDINELLSGVETDEDMKIAETSFMEAMSPESEKGDMDLWAEALDEQKQVEAKRKGSDTNETFPDIEEMLRNESKEPTDTDRIKKAPAGQENESDEDSSIETSLIEDLSVEDLSVETSLIEDLSVETSLIEDLSVETKVIENRDNSAKNQIPEISVATDTFKNVSAILSNKSEPKKPSKPFVPSGVIPDISYQTNNQAGLNDPFLNRGDLLSILQFGVNQKISELLSSVDNQAIMTILKESFKEFIDQSIKESSDNFSNLINTAIDNKINDMLNTINLDNIVNQVISSTIKGIFREFDSNILTITKDLIENNINAMLQEKLLPLKSEIQGIIWEKLPEMAENIIKKEIEMIKTDTVN
jgi:DNA-binding response OmpR family regulator